MTGRLSWIIMIVLVSVVVNPATLRAQGNADEAAIRKLVKQHFDAYRKEDLEGVMACWSASSPMVADFKQFVGDHISTAEKIRFENITLTRWKIEQARAFVRLRFEHQWRFTATKEAARQTTSLDVEFVKEAGAWKFWMQQDTDSHFAERLDAAKTKEERAELLKDEKELVTTDLLSMLVAAGVRRASKGEIHDALRLNDISFEVADALGGGEAKADCYWFRAAVFRYQSKYQEALEDYQHALPLFEGANNLKKAVTLKNIGEIYYLTKKYDEAVVHFEESLKLMRDLGEREQEAKIRSALGMIYHLNSNYPAALVHLEERLKIVLDPADKPEEAEVRNELGIIYRLTGRYEEALAQHQACLKIREELDDRPGVASSLNNIGNVYQSAGDYPNALTRFQMSLEIARLLRDKNAQARSLNNIGVIYQLLSKYTDALAQHVESLKLAGEADNEAEMLKARGNIGLIYKATGKYSDALMQYEANVKLARERGNRNGEAVARGSIGIIHQETGSYAEALAQYVESLKIFIETHDKAGEVTMLSGIGEVYRLTGRYDEARAQFEASLKINREIGDKEGEATALGNIGRIYQSTGRYAEALARHEERLAIAREINNRVLEAEALVGIGSVHALTGNYAEALTRYEERLKMAQQMGVKEGESTARNGLGVVNTSIGRYAEALAQFEAGLKIERDTGDRAGEGAALNNIGEVYRLTGRYDEARAQFEASLKINREIGDKEDTTPLIGIGLIEMATGKYAAALAQFEAALKIAREVGDKPGQSRALGNTGIVYVLTGKYDQALAQQEAALALVREMGDRAGESKGLGNVGVIYQSTGEYDKALTHLAASLKIVSEIGDRAGEATARGAIAEVFRLTGRHADALTQFDESLKIALGIGDKARESAVRYNSGLVHALMGDYDEALARFEVSLKIARRIGERFSEARVLSGMAAVYRLRKQWRRAADACRTAIALIESMRVQTKEPSLQTSFFAHQTSPYYVLVESLLELGPSPDEIFAASEGAKARTLVELISGGKIDILKSMTAAERQKEQELKANFIAASAQLNAPYSGPNPERRLDDLKQQLDKARAEYAEFRVKQFIAHPELQAQRASHDPLALAQLSKPLFAKNPNLCLLSYLVGDAKTFLLVITSGKGTNAPVNLTVLTLKTDQNRELTADELTGRLNTFRRRLAHESGPYKQLARELYDSLLAPAKQALKGRGHVVIIPDGVLHTLPFQALLDEQGKHFIESHTVSYAPSVSALIKMMKLADEKKTSNDGIRKLFAMGRSAFPDQVQYSNRKLPRAEEQVELIARLFGVVPLTGIEATEARAVSEMGAARYVHFATHGELNEVAPMESAILLGKGANDDGMLYARELVDMKLQAELVVLSACETGLGQSVSGEGIMGLSWALFVAGTPTSVMTQWKVSDDSMNRLMLEFYRQMRLPGANGRPKITKAEALRQAQRALMKNGSFTHPYHWAPVTLIGDWR